MNQSVVPKYRREVIIPVIGMTGAGKSTFINHLANPVKPRDPFPVGEKLTPCTTDLKSITISFDHSKLTPELKIVSALRDYVFTLVDTPGFNNVPKLPDIFILKRVVDCVKSSGKELGGIIYLHDITQDTGSEKAEILLKLLERMCSQATNNMVVFGTTKGQRMEDETAWKNRQAILKTKHWCSMIGKGARVLNFDNTRASALQFLELIVNAGEILIPVMGESGVGKSRFINYVLGKEQMPVGSGVLSCTDVLQSATVVFNTPTLKNYSITLLDTPGFDHNSIPDADIIRNVDEWLKESYRQKKVLRGVIYLHNMSNEVPTAVSENFKRLVSMCGDPTLCNLVIIGTRNSKTTSPDVAQRHQAEPELVHWSHQKGIQVFLFQQNRDSAIKIIESIVQNREM